MFPSLRPRDINRLLLALPDNVRVLSLDCFDTLIWRDTNAPRDVFADLDIRGGGIELRMYAEREARRIAKVKRRSSEVSLAEIYRQLMPKAADEDIQDAVDRELGLEARHCFAFPPMVQLMREAKAVGLKIIVVSDTYFSVGQLGDLIARAGGEDTRSLIDQVFTSMDQGTSKTEGLFPIVLKELNVAAASVLHFGDNMKADCISPSRFGVRVAHFVQFDEVAEKRLRLEAVSAAMLDAAVRVARPAVQPHRAQVAMRTNQDPAFALGHDVIGPILFAFAQWLRAEQTALEERTGKTVRPLFMMRDGYLPLRAFEILYPDTNARPVELTRLVAARAGVCNEAEIIKFVEGRVGTMSHKALARHLSLSESELTDVLGPHTFAENDHASVAEALTRPRAIRRINKRAQRFGKRLHRHLQKNGVRQGDCVMLVDLGYNGSAQSVLEHFLTTTVGVETAGRYLLLRAVGLEGDVKRGLIDDQNYEIRTLHGISRCVAVLEQICTLAVGSTVDFDDDGEPLREVSDIKGNQSAVRDLIQDGALAFVAATATQTSPACIRDLDQLREMSFAALGRLFLLPLETEVALFEAFEHDVNMGGESLAAMLDRRAVVANLRHFGLPYINGGERYFIPGELQPQGLPLNLAFLTSLRFSLDLRDADFAVGGIEIDVVLADRSGQTSLTQAAYPTADGFYRLSIPIGVGSFVSAVAFGKRFHWVQIESVRMQSIQNLSGHDLQTAPVVNFVIENMHARAPGLYEVAEDGLLIVPPPGMAQEPLVTIVVFRPISMRDKVERARVAVAA